MTSSPRIHADKADLAIHYRDTDKYALSAFRYGHDCAPEHSGETRQIGASILRCPRLRASVVKYYLCFDHCSCQVKYRYFHATTCLR